MLARTSELFADPTRSALHLATLPGALPVQETLELDVELRAAASSALGAVFVTRAPARTRIGRARIAVLEEHARAGGELHLAGDLARPARDVALGDAGRARIHDLRERTGRAVIELPTLESVRPDTSELLALGRRALEGVA